MEEKVEGRRIEELKRAIAELQKKSGVQPRKFEIGPNGAILLDPNNENDREWFENDEDYGRYE